MAHKESIEAKNGLENYAYSLKGSLYEASISEADRKHLEAKLDE